MINAHDLIERFCFPFLISADRPFPSQVGKGRSAEMRNGNVWTLQLDCFGICRTSWLSNYPRVRLPSELAGDCPSAEHPILPEKRRRTFHSHVFFCSQFSFPSLYLAFRLSARALFVHDTLKLMPISVYRVQKEPVPIELAAGTTMRSPGPGHWSDCGLESRP